MFKGRDARVDVETEGRLTKGQSVVDWFGQTGRPVNCKILLEVNSAEFENLFVDSLKQAGGAAERPAKKVKLSNLKEIDMPPPGTCKGPRSCCHATKSGTAVTRVGVGVLVIKEDLPGKVLVGKRAGSHGAGRYQLPGGHLEIGESWEHCAIRECEEETGIVLKKAQFLAVTNDHMPEDGKHYVTIIMIGVCSSDQVARLMEPDKCEGWSWEDWKQMPSPLFHPLSKVVSSGFELPSPEEVMKGDFFARTPPSLRMGCGIDMLSAVL